jgi:hypothetical protein
MRGDLQVLLEFSHTIVIPAKAGTHGSTVSVSDQWVPAFAGMTG